MNMKHPATTVGKLAFYQAERAGWKPKSVDSALCWSPANDTTSLNITLRSELSDLVLLSIPVRDYENKSLEEISGYLQEKWPEIFTPKIDPKAEMKAKICQTYADAIESLDKLRATLLILKEATE